MAAWETRSRAENPYEFNDFILVTDDGRVVIDNARQSFDLDHTPIEKVNDRDRFYVGDLMPRRTTSPSVPRQQGLASLVNPVAGIVRGTEQWFLVVDGPHDNFGYFEGFDQKQLQRVGYIGRNGFQQSRPSLADRFPIIPAYLSRGVYESYRHLVAGKEGTYLLTDGRVDFIDFDARTIRPLLDDVVDIGRAAVPATDPYVPINVAVRTDTSISIYDGDGQRLSSVPIPPELRERPIQFYPFDGESVMVATLTDWDSVLSASLPVTQQEIDVVRVTNDGQIISRTLVSLKRRSYVNLDIPWFIAAGVPSPVWTFGIVMRLHVVDERSRHPELTLGTVLGKSLANFWVGIVIMLLITAYLAWKTWQHHRRTGEPGTWVWVVFVAMTGLPGYIGYRLHRQWPRTGPLPVVVRTGTEVFA